jgi:hypothetical protein
MVTEQDARAATLALLDRRAPDATVCPSEVARSLAVTANAHGAAENWRAAMPVVHAAIDALLHEGLVQISWKGATLMHRAGPYRIARHPDRRAP